VNVWTSLQMLRRYGARRRSARARRNCNRIAEDAPLPAAEKLSQPGKISADMYRRRQFSPGPDLDTYLVVMRSPGGRVPLLDSA
jgi:hypothetical protein